MAAAMLRLRSMSKPKVLAASIRVATLWDGLKRALLARRRTRALSVGSLPIRSARVRTLTFGSSKLLISRVATSGMGCSWEWLAKKRSAAAGMAWGMEGVMGRSFLLLTLSQLKRVVCAIRRAFDPG